MEVQEIKSMGRVIDKTNCISQYTLDFSVFAKTCLEHGAEEEIEVTLQPKGTHGAAIRLRAFVSATLLRNWSPDLESTSSELSYLTSSVAADCDEYGYDDSQVCVHRLQHTPAFGALVWASLSLCKHHGIAI